MASPIGRLKSPLHFINYTKDIYKKGARDILNLYEMKQALSSGKTIFDLPLNVSYYARVSTEKEEQINSLENQVAFFEDYIKKNINWTYICGYVDEGISGTTSLKRENFMKMIEDRKK